VQHPRQKVRNQPAAGRVKARGIASHSSPCGSLHHCLSHSSPCSSSPYGRTMAPTKPSPPPPPLDKLHGKTLVVDVEGWILRPPMSAFPYFMLVAVEAGGFLRGLLLLLLCPLLSLLGDGARTRAMATVALVGLEERRWSGSAGRCCPSSSWRPPPRRAWRRCRRRRVWWR
jgi:hypothetical protein